MSKEQCTVDIQQYVDDPANFDVLKEAASKLLQAQESQFEAIKKEKWYNRLFDFVTFSHKNEKRMAEQIGTLAQAQNIFMEVLTMLSASDSKVADLAKSNMEYIKRLAENDNYLLSRLRTLENHILGINKAYSIINLSERDKSILSGCLIHIAKAYDIPSDTQQQYANTVLQAIQNNGDSIDHLDNAIDSLSDISKKNILFSCFEMIFLNNNTMSIPDTLDDFIDCFDLGKRTISDLKQRVEDTYQLRGTYGIIEKYASDLFEEEDLFFDIEFEDDISDEEDIPGTASSDTESTASLEEYYISSILHINEEETYTLSNKIVHLSAYVNCDGLLEFKNCRIYYNENSSADEIILSDNAGISFHNCEIICCGYDEKVFISGKRNNSFIFDACTFENCSYFVESSDITEFALTNSKINNCARNFIDISTHGYSDNEPFSCIISDCVITETAIADFNTSAYASALIKITDYSSDEYLKHNKRNHVIKNITVVGSKTTQPQSNRKKIFLDSFDFRIFSYSAGKITDCTFVDIDNCITDAVNVQNCQFKGCNHAIIMKSNYRNSHYTVSNCNFENCTNIIQLSRNANISYCRFQNCYDRLITADGYRCCGTTVEYCEFINIENRYEPLRFESAINHGNLSNLGYYVCKEKDSLANRIQHCIFDGIQANHFFLIQSYGFDKPNRTVVYLEDCDFRNCTTKQPSGSLIKTHYQYDTVFKKGVDCTTISTSSCRGLDKVNCEGTHTTETKEENQSVKGSKIGSIIAGASGISVAASLASSVVGLAGFPIGATLGAAASIYTTAKAANNAKHTNSAD